MGVQIRNPTLHVRTYASKMHLVVATNVITVFMQLMVMKLIGPYMKNSPKLQGKISQRIEPLVFFRLVPI